jgi:hypothetical protein
MRQSHLCLWSLCSLVLSTTTAFSPIVLTHQRSSVLWGGGFGDAAASANKKEVKLKPKQQWDRYIALKKEPSIPVGVRVVASSSEADDANWLEVGAIKRQPEISIDVAVARQRALLVEVCTLMAPIVFRQFQSLTLCAHFFFQIVISARQTFASIANIDQGSGRMGFSE